MFELEFWKDLGHIFDAVMNYQKKNVEFNNHFINPWIRLGNVFERNDQTNDAVLAYQRSIELDPDSAQNWVNLGDAQFKNGAYNEAIEAYRKAVTLDPEAGWPVGNLALSLVTQGKTEEAIPLYLKSIDLLVEVKDKAICWNRLGNAYRKLNDYENAFLAFQKADQFDGENTGFSDTLDEAQLTGAVAAPEEIFEQMLVDQAREDDEAEPAALDVANESVEEILQPETELESAEATDEQIALAPNIEMKDEEAVAEEDVEHQFETELERATDEVEDIETDEETPLTLHEKNLGFLQIVKNVITKVEEAYIAEDLAQSLEQQEMEEVSLETNAPAVSQDQSQEDEVVAPTDEETTIASPAADEVVEQAAQEVEAPIADDINEEATQEVTVVAETNEDATPEIEAPVAIKEEQEPVAEMNLEQDAAQVESVTTLSEISHEGAVSDVVVNMDVVETFTDPLGAQLTTEPSLSEEIIHETAEQAQSPVEEAEVEEQEKEILAEDESAPVEESAIVEESSIFLDEGEATELAYEEYLKDVVEPTNILQDHVDEIQSEAPLTKVSKNGEVRIAMDTKNAHVWNELGNIYLNAGTYDDAITAYSKAIELDRHFAWPYSNLALAYVQRGRFAEAILLYQRGIELFATDKDKAITWNRLGNVYRRVNDYSNAIAAYQTADELDPENATLSLRSSFGLLGNMYSDSKPAFAS